MLLCPQQVNMPYVMIPAFPPSHQPLPVTPDSQLALPIQPIPCKPGECGREPGNCCCLSVCSVTFLGLGLGSV